MPNERRWEQNNPAIVARKIREHAAELRALARRVRQEAAAHRARASARVK